LAEVVKLNPENPEWEIVDRAARVLRAGGVAAFPTDTIYGLGCSALSGRGLSTMRELKGLRTSPFIVLIAGEDCLSDLVRDVTPLAANLMRRFWPGPLTLVLDAAPGVTEGVRSADGTIAVRVPGSSFCLSLCRALEAPVASTSANVPGASPAVSPAEVEEAFGASIDLIVDGGDAPRRLPSTLVDARGETPVLLRDGTISIDLDAGT
jgi:L-threonylcarbamoyladenylate synthase